MGKNAKVLFAYVAMQPDELSLTIGDTLTVLEEEIYPGWHKGEHNGVAGVFPSNFVEVFDETNAGTSSSTPGDDVASVKADAAAPAQAPVKASDAPRRCQATHAYTKAEADELSFEKGDIIEIITEDSPDWWTGRVKGQVGMFPSNFVKLLPDDVASAEAAPVSQADTARPAAVPAPPAPAEAESAGASSAKKPPPGAHPIMPVMSMGGVGGGEPAWKRALLEKKRKQADAAGGGEVSTGPVATLSDAGPEAKKDDGDKPAWMRKRESKLREEEAEADKRASGGGVSAGPVATLSDAGAETKKDDDDKPAWMRKRESKLREEEAEADKRASVIQAAPEEKPRKPEIAAKPVERPQSTDDTIRRREAEATVPDTDADVTPRRPKDAGPPPRPQSEIFAGAVKYPPVGMPRLAGLAPKITKPEPSTEVADSKGTGFDDPADAASTLSTVTKTRPKKPGVSRMPTRGGGGNDADRLENCEKMIQELKLEINTLRQELRAERHARETLEDRVLALE